MVAASRVGSAVLRVVGAMVDLVACGGAIIGEESAGADAGAGAAGAGGAGGGADCRCMGGDGVSIGEGSSKTTGGSCGRSAERRVGKECVSTCRSRVSPCY